MWLLAPVSIIQAENDGVERAIPAKLALKFVLPDERSGETKTAVGLSEWCMKYGSSNPSTSVELGPFSFSFATMATKSRSFTALIPYYKI